MPDQSFTGQSAVVVLIDKRKRHDSMATQPPCDEGGKLVVSETVIGLEHAQLDR